MSGRDGYIGLRRRDRWGSAGATMLTAMVLFLLYLSLDRPAPPRTDAEAALRTFDVTLPPPPVEPPPPDPPAVTREAPRPRAGGGAPGRQRERPAEVSVDSAPPVAAPPPTPLVRVDAPLPAVGRSVGVAAGGHGAGTGEGEGRGSGQGAGTGTGDGGGSARYARTEWISPPKAADFVRDWPRKSPQMPVPVHVMLACDVLRAGYLRRCTILREEQPGYGAAAIKIIHYSRAKPVRRNGHTVDMPVLVPLAFQPLPPPKPRRAD